MEQIDPNLGRSEMEDMWNTSPESPQPAASAASAAPPYSTPKSNGASKRATKALARVEPSKKGRRNRSPYWAYYDKLLVDGKQKAVCKYCSRKLGCDSRSGTSVLKNHIERCKGYPPKLNPDEVFEQCSPLPASTLDPSDKFPAARTVYQMMETMARQRTGRTPWAIRETEFSYKMRFDMPGLTRNDVKVWIEDNVLVVEAEKVPKRCQNGKVEIGGAADLGEDDEWPVESYGKYSNKIALPESVDVENVKAGIKDGVLYITVPKARVTSGRRRIDIHVQ